MKKDKNSDHLAVLDNYNFCDKHTDGHGDSMTDPAQRAESVKIVLQSTLELLAKMHFRVKHAGTAASKWGNSIIF